MRGNKSNQRKSNQRKSSERKSNRRNWYEHKSSAAFIFNYFPHTSSLTELDYYSAIRLATKEDSQPVITLIDSVLAEWNDAVCLEDSEKDLVDLETHYLNQGGVFVVMEVEQKIVGSHAILPIDPEAGRCTFKRLYLAPEFRGTRAGHDLMQWNIDWSKRQGFRRVEFWSDTRFHRAHRFFEKFGFEQSGQPREMNDSHETYWEYFFSKDLNP